jgi:hypothetical protein
MVHAAKMDKETGLIIENGFETVKENCTACHSAKLIIQNRMDRDGWIETIRWMQDTQGLWQFTPETEKIILDYLSLNYAPQKTYRRAPLTVEWE